MNDPAYFLKRRKPSVAIMVWHSIEIFSSLEDALAHFASLHPEPGWEYALFHRGQRLPNVLVEGVTKLLQHDAPLSPHSQ